MKRGSKSGLSLAFTLYVTFFIRFISILTLLLGSQPAWAHSPFAIEELVQKIQRNIHLLEKEVVPSDQRHPKANAFFLKKHTEDFFSQYNSKLPEHNALKKDLLQAYLSIYRARIHPFFSIFVVKQLKYFLDEPEAILLLVESLGKSVVYESENLSDSARSLLQEEKARPLVKNHLKQIILSREESLKRRTLSYDILSHHVDDSEVLLFLGTRLELEEDPALVEKVVAILIERDNLSAITPAVQAFYNKQVQAGKYPPHNLLSLTQSPETLENLSKRIERFIQLHEKGVPFSKSDENHLISTLLDLKRSQHPNQKNYLEQFTHRKYPLVVRAVALNQLSRLEDSSKYPTLYQVLLDLSENEGIRALVAKSLYKYPHPLSERPLRTALQFDHFTSMTDQDARSTYFQFSLRALLDLVPKGANDLLLDFLKSDSLTDFEHSMVIRLALEKRTVTVSLLLEMLRNASKFSSLNWKAIQLGLNTYGPILKQDEKLENELILLLDDSQIQKEQVIATVSLLAQIGGERSALSLIEYLMNGKYSRHSRVKASIREFFLKISLDPVSSATIQKSLLSKFLEETTSSQSKVELAFALRFFSQLPGIILLTSQLDEKDLPLTQTSLDSIHTICNRYASVPVPFHEGTPYFCQTDVSRMLIKMQLTGHDQLREKARSTLSSIQKIYRSKVNTESLLRLFILMKGTQKIYPDLFQLITQESSESPDEYQTFRGIWNWGIHLEEIGHLPRLLREHQIIFPKILLDSE